MEAAIKAGAEASRQVGEVPKRHVKGKAGSEKDPVKEAAVKAGADTVAAKSSTRASPSEQGAPSAQRRQSEADVKRAQSLRERNVMAPQEIPNS